MDDAPRNLPTLPPLADVEPEPPKRDEPAPDPPPRRRRRRPTEPERLLHPAGHALVVAALALLLGSLLSAPGIHKSAYNQADGWKRDIAVAITGPLADVSHALRLDRPRQAIKDAIGRGDDDEIDVELGLPPVQAAGQGSRGKTESPAKRAFTPKRPLRLSVVGDSLVIIPGYAILRAASATPVIKAVGGVEGRVATGLTRPDVYNWFEAIRETAKRLKPNVVVLGFGGNDDKAYMTGLPEGVTISEFNDAAWQREYGRRVGGLMDLIDRQGAFAVWIGLPITQDADQTRRFDAINAVAAREARKREGRSVYVDTYTLFASDSGGFARYLTSPSGRQTEVRAPDGVHFSHAGGDIIARQVLKALNRQYDLTSWRSKQSR